MPDAPNLVLVHGAWADGSCWGAVIERLQADGVTVTAPQFPLTALDDDVARLRHVLRQQDGPTVVAGHSYGGQIITALGADAPNVVGLGLRRRLRPRRGRVHRRPAGAGPAAAGAGQPAHRRPGASPGCGGTTSSTTSPPTSDPSRPGSCTRSSSRCTRTRFDAGHGGPGVDGRCRPGTSWPRTTRPSRPTPSACSRSAWARRPSRSPAGHLAMVSHPDDVATLLKGALAAAAVAG